MCAASNEQNWVEEPSLNTRRSIARALSAFTHLNVTLTHLQRASAYGTRIANSARRVRLHVARPARRPQLQVVQRAARHRLVHVKRVTRREHRARSGSARVLLRAGRGLQQQVSIG